MLVTLSRFSKILNRGKTLLLAVTISVLAGNGLASDLNRDNASPAVGDVLLEATDPAPIRVLISKFHTPNVNYKILEPTLQALEKVFGKGKIHAEVFRGGVVDPHDADLILTSSGAYQRHAHLGTRNLATLVSDRFPDPSRAEGGVFVVLNERTDLNALGDLFHRRVAAPSPYSFAGWQVGMHEIFLNGFDPESFFAKSLWTHDMRQALVALRDRRADVIFLRSCMLEELNEAGESTADLRVIHAKSFPMFPCQISTDLFPNWTFYATAHADPEVARKAASALLGLTPIDGNLRWTIATDFTQVDKVFFDLKEGPYEYRRHWTFKQFWERYGTGVIMAVLIFIGLILHAWRTEKLLNRRTLELTQIRKTVQETNERLSTMQKMGIIGQLSSMIAHELRQPLSAVISYTHGLQRILERENQIPTELLRDTLERINADSQKIDTIVEHVRKYAKSSRESRTVLNFSRVIRESVDDLQKQMTPTTKIDMQVTPGLQIRGNALEWHLVIVNLVKNAVQATDHLMAGKVVVQARADSGNIVLSVSDNGPALSPRAFAQLLEPLKTQKLAGLGLGLTIVQLIVENHGGTLSVRRNQPTGLVFIVTLPEAISA